MTPLQVSYADASDSLASRRLGKTRDVIRLRAGSPELRACSTSHHARANSSSTSCLLRLSVTSTTTLIGRFALTAVLSRSRSVLQPGRTGSKAPAGSFRPASAAEAEVLPLSRAKSF